MREGADPGPEAYAGGDEAWASEAETTGEDEAAATGSGGGGGGEDDAAGGGLPDETVEREGREADPGGLVERLASSRSAWELV